MPDKMRMRSWIADSGKNQPDLFSRNFSLSAIRYASPARTRKREIVLTIQFERVSDCLGATGDRILRLLCHLEIRFVFASGICLNALPEANLYLNRRRLRSNARSAAFARRSGTTPFRERSHAAGTAAADLLF